MVTVTQQLEQLLLDKQELLNYLIENNIEITDKETFTTLITKLKNSNIGNFSPKHISFYGYSGTDLSDEISNIDFSKINNLTSMFNGCKSLKSVDLSECTFDKISSMSSMFYQCNAITTIDLGNLDTSSVTSMVSLFYQCYNLKTLDLSKFDTSNVTNFYNMFNYCEDLETLDLSNFVIDKATNISNMFWMCTGLKHLDIRNFDFTNVTSYSYFFHGQTDCEIIVKDEVAKAWMNEKFPSYTNVKTVAEYEGTV